MINYKENPYYKATDLEVFFNSGLEIYKKNFGWFFFYSLIGSIIIQLASTRFLSSYLENIEQIADNPQMIWDLMGGLGIMLIISLIVYVSIDLFISYWVLDIHEAEHKGHSKLLKESMSKFFLPMLVVTIICGITIMLGAIIGVFIFIIGMFIALLYFAAVFFPITPVVIQETTNPFEAIGRSIKLVHKDFWASLGMILVLIILYIVASLIFSVLVMIPFAADFFEAIKNPMGFNPAETINPLQLLLSSIVNAVMMPLFPIFGVVLYLGLKHKEDQEVNKDELLEQIAR